jgi:hypothetical protein
MVWNRGAVPLRMVCTAGWALRNWAEYARKPKSWPSLARWWMRCRFPACRLRCAGPPGRQMCNGRTFGLVSGRSGCGPLLYIFWRTLLRVPWASLRDFAEGGGFSEAQFRSVNSGPAGLNSCPFAFLIVIRSPGSQEKRRKEFTGFSGEAGGALLLAGAAGPLICCAP